MDADAVVVGGGLAGLVVATEVAGRGRRVILLEQEPHLGGQAFWSFGGLFLVDSPGLPGARPAGLVRRGGL
ncbi:FAD-dependent oxidoreductase [Thermus islandicus]|uniref:FAD-dependent oxidoreductase n=1 Tax=Thermus islandicus TaxID=540988 RepID=UPI0003B35D5B|nr:FAD-dependent oxidoreductase [Thermus islandicus]